MAAIILILIFLEVVFALALEKYQHIEVVGSRLRLRLEEYAKLKTTTCSDRSIQSCTKDLAKSPSALSGEAHEVLLGALKKVEGKNAVLAAIITFALTLFLAQLSDNNVDYAVHLWVKQVSSVAASMLLVPLAYTFVGIRHLDLVSVAHVDSLTSSILQENLLRDLVKKEVGFRFSLYTSGTVVITGIALILLPAIQF